MIDADNIGFGIGNENAIKRMFDYGVEPFLASDSVEKFLLHSS